MTITQFPIDISFKSLNGKNGLQIFGTKTNENFGSSVSGLGDINGDGITDLIIGAYSGGQFNSGSSYILFGSRNIAKSGFFSISTLNGHNGFNITGAAQYSQSGQSVSSAGDINDDGIADFVIGAPYASPNGRKFAGISYVVFGKSNIGSSGTLLLTTLNGSNGFTITGANAGDSCGSLIVDLGDINGDRISDLAVVAPDASPGGINAAGMIYIIFGKKNIGTSGTLDLASFSASDGFSISGQMSNQFSGFRIDASDINDDGLNDLIIGMPAATALVNRISAGLTYVIFGSTTISSSGSLSLASINGHNGFIVGGAISYDYSGTSISGLDDVNDDGIADFIIGAPGASPEGKVTAGAAYVIFGNKNNTTSMYLDLSTITGNKGLVVIGNIADGLGSVVSKAGDVNGDGIADMLIGSSYDNYVIFGSSHLTNLTLFDVTTLTGSNGFVINADVPLHTYVSYYTLREIGDINDDGIDDLIKGIPNAYNLYLSPTGVCYILFGDVSPQLIVNQLSLSQGQTLLLNSANLNATDTIHSRDTLLFTASQIEHGKFMWANGTGPLTTFSQGAIDASQIIFIHDGSPIAPSYSISVNNSGFAYFPPQKSKIHFNAAPIIVNNTMMINQGQSIILTSSYLSAIDIDNNPANLIFTISGIQHGQFNLLPQANVPITTFLQFQITQQQLQFTHDGSDTPPSYQVSVNDGLISNMGGAQATSIDFDAMPVVIANQLQLNQGESITLTLNNVKAVNPFARHDLTFIVSSIQHGHFERAGIPDFPITTFNLSEVSQATIIFIHDNSQYPPSYILQVTDGRMTTNPQLAHITFNSAPVLINNQLTIGQGETVVLSLFNLNTTDIETPASELIFIASDIQNGYFENVQDLGTTITMFSQQQIINANIAFVASNTDSVPMYDISVSDGNITTQSFPATVNFNLATTNDQESIIRNSIIGSCVSGFIGLCFLFLKHYFNRKAKQNLQITLESNASQLEREQAIYRKEIIQVITNKVFKRIDTLGFFGYRNEQDSKIYLAAIESIVGKLSQLGMDVDLKNMHPSRRNILVNEIARQAQRQVRKSDSGCFRCYCRFFRAETSPQEFEDQIDPIVNAVYRHCKATE